MFVRQLTAIKANTTKTKMSAKQAKNWTAMNHAKIIK